MSIASIIKSVQVKAPPAQAFELFATRMEAWWPRGRTIGGTPHVDIIIEPHAGGRWFERDAQGRETQWGRVLAWEPPARLLLAWQIDTQWRYDPDLVTEVELTFVPSGSGTRVTLEHRNLERFGRDAVSHVGRLNGGWPAHLASYAAYADSNA